MFLDEGWTRTGDIGLVDADGYFYLVDRNPDIVNTGGLNVSTLDIEAALMEYPGVIEAAVVGIAHPVLTECVVAAVRARPDLDVDDLLAVLKERKGPAAPQRIAVVADLPRNLLGKIDKKQLRRDLEADALERAYVAPSTTSEVLVAEIWAVTLDLDQVSLTDDFLQLGGSSLTAMEVVSQVGAQLGRKVAVRDLLDTATLADFVQRVDTAAASEPEPASAR